MRCLFKIDRFNSRKVLISKVDINLWKGALPKRGNGAFLSWILCIPEQREIMRWFLSEYLLLTYFHVLSDFVLINLGKVICYAFYYINVNEVLDTYFVGNNLSQKWVFDNFLICSRVCWVGLQLELHPYSEIRSLAFIFFFLNVVVENRRHVLLFKLVFPIRPRLFIYFISIIFFQIISEAEQNFGVW